MRKKLLRSDPSYTHANTTLDGYSSTVNKSTATEQRKEETLTPNSPLISLIDLSHSRQDNNGYEER